MARKVPEVNAGSMADISFLLLIFFLVTTTIESDRGITRRLPPIDDSQEETTTTIRERNIFTVIINNRGDLLVNDEPMSIQRLRQATTDFIDNGAGTGSDECSYCRGKKDPNSSDNPSKALVSIQFDRQTKYEKYMAVQNEIMAAYNELRDRVSQGLYGEDFTQMNEDYQNTTDQREKDKLQDRIKKVRDLYPLNISEAKPEEV